MDKLQAQLVGQKFSWGDAWMKFNMLNGGSYKGQYVSLGATTNDHTFETTYDLSKKFKGF